MGGFPIAPHTPFGRNYVFLKGEGYHFAQNWKRKIWIWNQKRLKLSGVGGRQWGFRSFRRDGWWCGRL